MMLIYYNSYYLYKLLSQDSEAAAKLRKMVRGWDQTKASWKVRAADGAIQMHRNVGLSVGVAKKMHMFNLKL